MRKLSLGWTAILLLLTIGFTSCEDEENRPEVPVLGTITDVASADARFSILASALQRTGLDQALDISTRRYTVFAPTDDAFAASGIDLNALSDEDLANVLLYHAINDANIASTAIPGGTTELATENTTGPGGGKLPLFVNNDGGNITINNAATVVVADVVTVNGTIHAIDQVLLPPSLLDRARLDGRFTTLISALERTGLDQAIAGAGTFTVFAPTDAAFAEANIDLNAVSDTDLSNLLLYHVLGQSVTAGNIGNGNSFATTLSASGPNEAALSLLIDKSSGNVTINDDATVVVADVLGTNGVIHAIDKVLAYQSLVDFTVKADGVSALEDAVVAAGLVGTLSGDGPFTVFAPVNAAFEAIAATTATLTTSQLANILAYHVLSGNVRSTDLSAGTVMTLSDGNSIEIRLNPGADSNSPDDDFFFIRTPNNTEVKFILTDIQASNGVIHLIEEVLLP